MKSIKIIICILAFASTAFAIEMPKIHTSIMLDAKFYSEDEANNGKYDNTNRYQIRKAAFALSGNVSKEVSYEFECGLSTCFGASTEFKLMDATIQYNLTPNTFFALKQGHVLRGFAGSTECSDRLTLEKPSFFKTFATCHPTGLAINTVQELSENSDIELEAAFLNGTNGTLDGEHDYNFGGIYNTPLNGLALSVNYNHVANNFYKPTGDKYSADGYRTMYGLSYENYNTSFTGEYYQGKGFDNDGGKHMKCYYLQAGYAINLGFEKLNYIQPYVKYEFWDKNSDADGNNPKAEYENIDVGLNFSLNSYTKIKVNYFSEISNPDGVTKTPDEFVTRLQISF